MSNLVKGNFKARGLTAALGYTSTGKEQVAVQLEILDEGFQGETITWYGSFSEQAAERTLESLRLLGWQGDDLFDLSGIGSKEVKAVLDEDEYEGKIQLKVKWINGPGGLALKAPMNEGEARAFSQRMKGLVLSHKTKSAAGTSGTKPSSASSARAPSTQQRSQSRPQAGRRDEVPPPTDDDLPF